MKSISFLLSLLIFTLIACQSNNEREEKRSSNKEYEIIEKVPPSGENEMSAETARLEELISESKKTLDSIDAAYSFVRKESRLQNLSLDEREQVNEALIHLNDTKDLIILEMEQAIITDLKEKTASLEVVMKDMHLKSEKLLHIAQTLSRISGIIANTTNLLSGALAVGLIRPRIVAAPGN